MYMLNDSGDDVIYETPGDAQRGNPLDIITVATCYDCEDVLREAKFDAKKTAKRMATCWNSHDGLVAALRELIKAVPRPQMEWVSPEEPPEFRTQNDYDLDRAIHDAETVLAKAGNN